MSSLIRTTSLSKIIFEKEGFIIAKGSDDVIYKGTIIQKGSEIEDVSLQFTGEFKNYKGEEQFCFTEYIIKQEYSSYFLENMVTGLSKKAIADIKLKCGNKFEEIIENNPNLLLGIKGVGEKSLIKIVKSFKENKHLKELAEFLLPFGITNLTIKKIYDTYGKESVSVLKENPYKLIEMKGVSFKKADDIAVKIGLDLDSHFRIRAGVVFAITNYFNSYGHTCISKEVFFDEANEALNVEDAYSLSNETFKNMLNDLIGCNELRYADKFESLITTTRFYFMEKYIHDTLKKYKHTHLGVMSKDIDKEIKDYENSLNILLDEKQKDAIILANSRYRITYLCGFAGTGKTSSSKLQLKLYENEYGYKKVVGCALSGVAAKRIENATGYKAYTIHTLLGYRGGSDFEFDEENKLDYAVVLLDEASMVDTYLFYNLLKAIDLETTSLIIMGDPAQLKAIGPGNFFEDIISKNLIFGNKLEKVFRQKKEQIINIFATNFIRKGLLPENYKDTNYEDFLFVNKSVKNSFQLKNTLTKNEYAEVQNNNKLQIIEEIKEIASNYLYSKEYWKTDIWKYITEFQVITPLKGNILGSQNLNGVIQSVFNPLNGREELSIFDKRFRLKDKVIHLKNENMVVLSTEEYKFHLKNDTLSSVAKDEDKGNIKRVFNGQMGVIIGLDFKNEVYSIYYPNEAYVALYNRNHFMQNNIDLAYSITIHKSQGSSFENLVIPMTLSHYVMLNNNLLYTAITRAVKKLYLVGEPFAFERACKNKADSKRFTVLENLE